MKYRVLLCMPLALKSVPTKTYTSIDRAKEYLLNNAHKLSFDVEVIGTYAPGTFPIDANRNQIAAYAIDKDFDITIWFDMDQTFPEDVAFKLLEHIKKHDIVTGMYYAKSPPYHPIIFHCNNPDKYTLFSPIVQYPKDKLFYADMIGMGCVAIKTDVFKAIEQPFFKYQVHPTNTIDPLWEMKNTNKINDVSEDVYFCKQALDAGFKIVVDPTIQCGHITDLVVTEGLFEGFFEGQKSDYIIKHGEDGLKERLENMPKARIVNE